MKPTSLVFLLAWSALPASSDAFPTVHRQDHGVRYIARPRYVPRHDVVGDRPTSRANNARGRNNIQSSAFASIRPLRSTSQHPSDDSGSGNLTTDSDIAMRALSVRGGDATAAPVVSIADKTKAFASKNFFLIGMVVAVSLAKLFPELGKNGSILRPELFIGNYGVTVIFLLSGLSLKLADLANAASNVKLNGMIQLTTFGAWPFLVGLPLTKGIQSFLPSLLPKPLLDGLLILTCLPTTINMCIILTSASGGNVATALCNTVISNLAGIFLTPALLLRFFGRGIELPFAELVGKLANKVLLPVAVGQALRATPAKDLYSDRTGFFKRLQEMVLLGIVWNAFCNAFSRGLGLEPSHAIALLVLLPLLHLGSLLVLFSFFRSKLFIGNDGDYGEAAAATFCGAHKTLAFGLPLINTVFEGNPNLASYCAPIMLMHPLQLVIGSAMVPFFEKFTKKEKVE